MSHSDGFDLIAVAVPQVPNWDRFNIAAYRVFGWALARGLLKSSDLIHSVDLGFAGILGSTWASFGGIRHVTQLTTDLERTLLAWTRSHVSWNTHVHGVACNSQALATQFARRFPLISNVRTVYRGVDLNSYHPCDAVAGPLAAKPPVRFLYLGGFPEYNGRGYGANTKGGETLLAVWHAAEMEMISAGASILIVGHRVTRRRLAGWLETLKEPSRVHLSDTIDPDLVAPYVRASDVVLVPSMQEGLPNLVMEAAACGRAVFGSKTGGIPEIVVPGETGLLLPPGDVTAWKNALVSYANNINDLKTMGQRARQRMEKLFDAKTYASQMMDLYTAALGEPIEAAEKRVQFQKSCG
jgi:glycosyltransferase involved in cell wall biosynthesis